MTLPSFPCSSCGACCRSLNGSNEYKDLDRGDGTCKHFDETTCLCTIYEERPAKCRIDHFYYQSLSGLYRKEDYYNMNIDACNKLQQQLQLPESYRIKRLINEKSI
jgi:uncharacterized protein